MSSIELKTKKTYINLLYCYVKCYESIQKYTNIKVQYKSQKQDITMETI